MLNFDDSRGLKKIKEEYIWFQQNEQDLLRHAASLLGKEQLDYSLAEIDAFGLAVQQLFRQHIPSPVPSDHIPAMFIAYYGNAMMYYFGGKWYYSTKKNEYGYGSPMLIEYGQKGIWTAIPPYDYFMRVEKDDFGNLSRLIKREIELYERKGLALMNPQNPS